MKKLLIFLMNIGFVFSAYAMDSELANIEKEMIEEAMKRSGNELRQELAMKFSPFSLGIRDISPTPEASFRMEIDRARKNSLKTFNQEEKNREIEKNLIELKENPDNIEPRDAASRVEAFFGAFCRKKAEVSLSDANEIIKNLEKKQQSMQKEVEILLFERGRAMKEIGGPEIYEEPQKRFRKKIDTLIEKARGEIRLEDLVAKAKERMQLVCLRIKDLKKIQANPVK